MSLAVGDSLVSSISVATVGSRTRWLFNTSADSPVESVSILTASRRRCLPTPSGRPMSVGTPDPLLAEPPPRPPARLASVSSTPSFTEYESHFRRPWIDALFFNFDSPVNDMPDYSREIARAVSMAWLLVLLDRPPEQRESLLVYLVQYGVDLSGLVERGHPGWPAHGGHGNGRKLPIVAAGVLLEQADLQHPPGVSGRTCRR